MTEEKPNHRNVVQTIAELIAHIDWKLSILPSAVKSWGLGEDALEQLSGNLKRERELLAKLPEDITLKEAMQTYFQGQSETADVWESLIPDDHPDKPRK